MDGLWAEEGTQQVGDAQGFESIENVINLKQCDGIHAVLWKAHRKFHCRENPWPTFKELIPSQQNMDD